MVGRLNRRPGPAKRRETLFFSIDGSLVLLRPFVRSYSGPGTKKGHGLHMSGPRASSSIPLPQLIKQAPAQLSSPGACSSSIHSVGHSTSRSSLVQVS